VTEVKAAPGLTVSGTWLLTKAVPVVVAPEMETWYGVGAVTVIVAGIMKATRRVVPTTVVTVVAAVVVDRPPAAGVMATVTEAGWIVPAGKLEPVRVMLVMPGCPAVGETAVESVT
jgi:hypothetical protein